MDKRNEGKKRRTQRTEEHNKESEDGRKNTWKKEMAKREEKTTFRNRKGNKV